MPNVFLDLFKETGAYLRGHFRLTSGLHSPEYLQSALVLQYPRHAQFLGARLAQELKTAAGGAEIEVVASPAVGGIVIGHEVARALGARAIFTERGPDGKMTLRRGFAVSPGESVAVVEDVITTGGSTREVIEVMRAGGASVVSAGSIVDRSSGTVDLGVPRVALLTLSVVCYPPENCPLCHKGVPVVKPGSRPSPENEPQR